MTGRISRLQVLSKLDILLPKVRYFSTRAGGWGYYTGGLEVSERLDCFPEREVKESILREFEEVICMEGLWNASFLFNVV